MNVYWSQKDIPALKGLSREARESAKRAVIGKVWKHWQVWLPFAILMAAYAVFFAVAPRFPFRLPFVLATAFLTGKVAALPYNSHLQFYLSRIQLESCKQSLNEQPPPQVITFKRHAHLFTLISVAWTVLSVVAVSLLPDNRDYGDKGHLITIGILVIHAACIGLAIYFWRNERMSILTVQEDEEEGTD